MLGARLVQGLLEELFDPGAGGVDQRAGAQRQQAAVLAFQMQMPQALAAPRADAAGARVDVRAMLAGTDGIGYHQAGIVDPAVGVFEAFGNLGLERAAGAEGQMARAWQAVPHAEVIVEEQPGADHPGWPQVRTVREDEAQRAHQVRRHVQQHLALAEGFAHQAEFVVLQVAQAAMDQLAAGRGGVRGEVVLLAEEHRQAAAGGVGGDAATVDAATNYGEVVDLGQRCGDRLGCCHHG
ncbi:hypothetical protein D3C78_1126310 [compost metagenome]